MLIIFLDTGPLGVITNPRKPALTLEALRWAASHIRAGNRIMVPAIADYEVRRELTRLARPASIASLDTWNSVPSERYISLTETALRLASSLRAHARTTGTATADPKELDCDALIASQALDYQSAHQLASNEIIIATTNVGHISLFIRADLWQNVLP